MRHLCAGLFLLVAASLFARQALAESPGTAFTYQGRLAQAGEGVVGPVDLAFRLYDAAEGGAQIGPEIVAPDFGDFGAGGVFAVELDFGAGAFGGSRRWLEVWADSAPLSPRQPVTGSPYSLSTRGIFVDGDNNVGIGTTTPGALLDVTGPGKIETLEITGGSAVVSGTLVGWGYNAFGQTNVPSGTFTAIAGGLTHSLAIRADGTLVGWGDNGSGQTTVPSGTFTAIGAGFSHSLAIRADGTLVGWGDNFSGQTNVPSGTFTALATGFSHSLAIRADGTLVGWGANDHGKTNVPSGTFIAIAAGGEHSLAIRADGTLVGWGANEFGQTNVPSGTFTTVAAGGGHSLAIRTSGTLVGWGRNSHGQTNVPSGTFIAIAARSDHSLAIRADGTLVGWGDNSLGQTNVPSGTFTTVAAGEYNGLAISLDIGDAALLLHADAAFKPGTGAWTIWSDQRLKTNIEPLDGALEKLLSLRGVSFEWNDVRASGGHTGKQMGLLADDVQQVFPEWVRTDPRGLKTLTVGGFEALTAEALRELRAEKDAKITELETRLERLEQALSASGAVGE